MIAIVRHVGLRQLAGLNHGRGRQLARPVRHQLRHFDFATIHLHLDFFNHGCGGLVLSCGGGEHFSLNDSSSHQAGDCYDTRRRFEFDPGIRGRAAGREMEKRGNCEPAPPEPATIPDSGEFARQSPEWHPERACQRLFMFHHKNLPLPPVRVLQSKASLTASF